MKNFFEKLLKLMLARTTKTLVKKVIKRIEKKTPEQTETKETRKNDSWQTYERKWDDCDIQLI